MIEANMKVKQQQEKIEQLECLERMKHRVLNDEVQNRHLTPTTWKMIISSYCHRVFMEHMGTTVNFALITAATEGKRRAQILRAFS